MRFLHTSDWHLGRSLHGVDLLDAQRDVLAHIGRLVADPPDGVPVDAVLVSGDIYDRAVPPVEAISLLAECLAELTHHTTVIITAGNHDSAIRLGFGSALFSDRLRVRTGLDSVGEPVLVGDVAVYPLPYLDPDAARFVLADGDEPLTRSHQAVLAAAMTRVRADLANRPAGTRSVVMSHAFVVGGAASESERSIVVGGVDSVAASTFDGVDYVALGHLHGAQQPRTRSRTVLRYCGSPLRYSFSEINHTKSVTLVDLGADGVTVTPVAVRQPREMAELSGELDAVLSDPELERHVDDWLRITITDQARPDHMFDRIKARFGHVLQVFHLPAGATRIGGPTGGTGAAQDPRELVADFVRYVTGTEATLAEAELFDQAYQSAASEAGV
jgi:exonuclease SbcD